MDKHSSTEGFAAEAGRILRLIFGLRQSHEHEQRQVAELTQRNGLVHGPLDVDQEHRLHQQQVQERGMVNGQVQGPGDPDQARTRLELLRDLQTEATGYRFALQRVQEAERAIGAQLVALEQRMQSQRQAQQEWQLRNQQQGQGR